MARTGGLDLTGGVFREGVKCSGSVHGTESTVVLLLLLPQNGPMTITGIVDYCHRAWRSGIEVERWEQWRRWQSH